MDMVSECGAISFLAVADALADHQRADEAGDAGVDVHDRAAGEVERAHLEAEAGVGVDRVELGLRRRLGRVVGRRGKSLGRVADRVRDRPSTRPYGRSGNRRRSPTAA